MKIGITGAKGFIGCHLVSHLLQTTRDRLRLIVRTSASPRAISDSERVQAVEGDLASIQACRSFIQELDVIFHLAHSNCPVTSDIDLPGDAVLNQVPLLNLIQAIRDSGAKPHIVYLSSGGAVYGRRPDRVPILETAPCDPVSSYGIQKLAGEHYLRWAASKNILTATILRVGNAYGALLPPSRKQGLLGVAINNVLHGRPVTLFGNLNNVRDYVHLDDVSRACRLAMSPAKPFDIYNVGCGSGHSVSEIVHLIDAAMGHPVERVHLESETGAQGLPDWIVLDVSKAHRELGWSPAVPLRHGIERMIGQGRVAAAAGEI